MIADEEGQQRDQDQPQDRRSDTCEVQDAQQHRQRKCAGVQHMPARQLLRLAIDTARQLAKGHDRPGKGHGADEDAQEHLDLQHGDLGRGLVGQHGGKAVKDLHAALGLGAQHAGQFDLGVEAHEDRGQADQRMHGRHKLRHFRHLHALRHDPADGPADGDHDQRQQPVARARPEQRGQHGQAHADDPVPDRALGAFLSRQPPQREDEQHGCDHIGRGGESVFHCCPLTTSGTWRASGA